MNIPERDPTTGKLITSPSPFAEAAGFEVKAKGFSGTVPFGTTANVQVKITEERWINGVELILKNHADGDYINFQVVDVDNVLGYGAGLVLKEFGDSWQIKTDTQAQGLISFPYCAKVLANLYVRVVYVSTGVLNVTVKCNMLLHKKTA